LRAFSDEVVPLLQPAAQLRKRFSIWSAGCSTGEEVYSIAAILQESNPSPNVPFRVLGSDISKGCLAHARRGVYGQSAMRATSIERTQRWFDQTNAGWMVKSSLRSMCQFGHVNLLDGERIASVGTVDVIFCRNVLIYFNDRTRREVIEHFYDRLVPGGVLFLGHAESLLNVSTDFELLHLRRDLAYRKPLSATDDPSVNLMGAGAVADPLRGSTIRSRSQSDEPMRQNKRVSS
jgi:chemotaxis protein methyltransferase CheR